MDKGKHMLNGSEKMKPIVNRKWTKGQRQAPNLKQILTRASLPHLKNLEQCGVVALDVELALLSRKQINFYIHIVFKRAHGTFIL